jgi:vacuolar-type H+-ATPase subunit C/Vma6
MIARWEDLVARVRGLSGHLLGRAQLSAMARAPDLIHLATALDDAYGPAASVGPVASPDQLELAVRRAAARYVRIVARWAGTRARYLAPLFMDEDRRSVRACVRGAAAATPHAERLAGLVPTPTLPERALEELARQRSVADVVALLVLWGHPFGAALLDEARRAHPDLFRLDLLLNLEFATYAARAVRRAPLGNSVRRDLRTWLHEILDLENAFTAVGLAAQRSSTDRSQFFIPGGRALDRATFLRAASAANATSAASILARALRSTSLAAVFGASLLRPVEDTALVATLQRTLVAARRSPLGAAPVIAFFTRLRAEVRDLRLIIWRAALGAPPVPADVLVTPA